MKELKLWEFIKNLITPKKSKLDKKWYLKENDIILGLGIDIGRAILKDNGKGKLIAIPIKKDGEIDYANAHKGIIIE